MLQPTKDVTPWLWCEGVSVKSSSLSLKCGCAVFFAWDVEVLADLE